LISVLTGWNWSTAMDKNQIKWALMTKNIGRTNLDTSRTFLILKVLLTKKRGLQRFSIWATMIELLFQGYRLETKMRMWLRNCYFIKWETKNKFKILNSKLLWMWINFLTIWNTKFSLIQRIIWVGMSFRFRIDGAAQSFNLVQILSASTKKRRFTDNIGKFV